MAPSRRAIDRGTLAVGVEWLRPVDHAPADVAGVLVTTAAGRCVFHLATPEAPPGRAGACAIQTTVGPGAIPSSCQHFPRICLTDSRGVFVTLSHYCPTAASLLFESEDGVRIVAGPPAPPDGALPEGLDAREALPPSLAPRRLMDLDAYAEFEREMVSVLTTVTPPEHALDVLERRAREMQADLSPGVTKGAGPFDLFAIARAAVPPYSWPEAVTMADDEWRRLEPAWQSFAPAIGRFLAAHAFGSWMAYQGNGLLALVMSLRQVLAVLRMEIIRRCQDVSNALDVATLSDAIRHTDLLLRHLADRERLASRLSGIA